MLERQGYHLLAWLLLGVGLHALVPLLPGWDGRMWGRTAFEWVVVSWVFAGVFQAWIACFWRAELYGRWITRALGKPGFRLFQTGFVLLAFFRFLPIVPISLASAGTLDMPRWVSITLLVGTTPPILWAMYSAGVYLGFTRATGADHFFEEYRELPLVTRGIYAYVPNAAYAVALLILYQPGLLWQSGLSLVVAVFHHAFVWCAYFCTEAPDMRQIYGTRPQPRFGA